MIASRDHRHRNEHVTLTMTMTEFREIVEWLELLSPYDGCTRELRAELDRIDPPEGTAS